MEATVKDVLTANLVLVGADLLNDPSRHQEFVRAIGSEVIFDSDASPQQASFNICNIPRDRISIESSAGKSTVARAYPEKEDIERLSQVAIYAIEFTTLESTGLRGVGFNIDLVVEQFSGESAQKYIAGRIFSRTIPVARELEIKGGMAQLFFQEADRTWTIRIEPRVIHPENENVYLTVNYHVSSVALPSELEIRNSLNATWDRAHAFVSEIDKNAG